MSGYFACSFGIITGHIKSIYKKLNVSSRAEAAVLASKQGLV